MAPKKKAVGRAPRKAKGCSTAAGSQVQAGNIAKATATARPRVSKRTRPASAPEPELTLTRAQRAQRRAEIRDNERVQAAVVAARDANDDAEEGQSDIVPPARDCTFSYDTYVDMDESSFTH